MAAITRTVTMWVDRITEDGQLNVKRVVRYFDDGVQGSDDKVSRIVLAPGSDVSGYPVRVQRVATAEHTPAVIAAWRAAHPQS